MNDCNWPLARYFHYMSPLPEPAVQTWMKIDPHSLQQKDSPSSAAFTDVKIVYRAQVG